MKWNQRLMELRRLASDLGDSLERLRSLERVMDTELREPEKEIGENHSDLPGMKGSYLGWIPDVRAYDYTGPTSTQEPAQEGYSVLNPDQQIVFCVQDEQSAAVWTTRLNEAYARGVQAQKILTDKLVKEGKTEVLRGLYHFLVPSHFGLDGGRGSDRARQAVKAYGFEKLGLDI